ncbi:MAG: hypothetical protein ACRC6B_05910, partial [Fusobacteriaceae bacterium]
MFDIFTDGNFRVKATMENAMKNMNNVIKVVFADTARTLLGMKDREGKGASSGRQSRQESYVDDQGVTKYRKISEEKYQLSKANDTLSQNKNSLASTNSQLNVNNSELVKTRETLESGKKTGKMTEEDQIKTKTKIVELEEKGTQLQTKKAQQEQIVKKSEEKIVTIKEKYEKKEVAKDKPSLLTKAVVEPKSTGAQKSTEKETAPTPINASEEATQIPIKIYSDNGQKADKENEWITNKNKNVRRDPNGVIGDQPPGTTGLATSALNADGQPIDKELYDKMKANHQANANKEPSSADIKYVMDNSSTSNEIQVPIGGRTVDTVHGNNIVPPAVSTDTIKEKAELKTQKEELDKKTESVEVVTKTAEETSKIVESKPLGETEKVAANTDVEAPQQVEMTGMDVFAEEIKNSIGPIMQSLIGIFKASQVEKALEKLDKKVANITSRQKALQRQSRTADDIQEKAQILQEEIALDTELMELESERMHLESMEISNVQIEKMDAIIGKLGEIKGAVLTAGNNGGGTDGDGKKKSGGGIMDTIKGGVTDFLGPTISGALGSAGNAISGLFGGGKEAATTVATDSLASAGGDALKGATGGAAGAGGGLGSGVVSAGKNMIGDIASNVVSDLFGGGAGGKVAGGVAQAASALISKNPMDVVKGVMSVVDGLFGDNGQKAKIKAIEENNRKIKEAVADFNFEVMMNQLTNINSGIRLVAENVA